MPLVPGGVGALEQTIMATMIIIAGALAVPIGITMMTVIVAQATLVVGASVKITMMMTAIRAVRAIPVGVNEKTMMMTVIVVQAALAVGASVKITMTTTTAIRADRAVTVGTKMMIREEY
jgi:hypothetical protein